MRLLLFFTLFLSGLSAHCQMPCGIYNDQMVYDQINQFYLTVFKAVKNMEALKADSLEDRNKFVRWVITKDRLCDETAELITKFFLQQKIQPIDDNVDLLKSLHKLLFLLVAIKQNVDIKVVQDFNKEWEHFKYLFHPELECKPVMKEAKNPYAEEESPKSE